jgi:hypothetical protein
MSPAQWGEIDLEIWTNFAAMAIVEPKRIPMFGQMVSVNAEFVGEMRESKR